MSDFLPVKCPTCARRMADKCRKRFTRKHLCVAISTCSYGRLSILADGDIANPHVVIQMGVLTANNLSTTTFAVNTCHSIQCPLRNPCSSWGWWICGAGSTRASNIQANKWYNKRPAATGLQSAGTLECPGRGNIMNVVGFKFSGPSPEHNV